MGRKLIVASTFFVIGLLITAFITVTLLMSLINRPAALSVARIAGAVNKSLDVLEKKGKLISGIESNTMPVSTLTLSAAIIGKAKQKGIPVQETPAILAESKEYKPVFSDPGVQAVVASEEVSVRRRNKWNINRWPTRQEALVYSLLSLHYGDASSAAKRSIATNILNLQQPDGGWSAFQGMPSDAYATGQTLYALQESGMFSPEAPNLQKAIAFLLKSQDADGSWRLAPISFAAVPGKEAEYQDEVARETETTHWASLALLESLPDKD